jgi:uncharacterized protein
VRRRVIVDTGPLVALLNARDRHHAWSVAQWAEIEPPLLTCESVISEACFLLGHTPSGGAPVLEMAARGALDIGFRLSDHVRHVRGLLHKYVDQPMSMAELTPDSAVLTLDRDFRVYRKHGRQVIPLLMPR